MPAPVPLLLALAVSLVLAAPAHAADPVVTVPAERLAASLTCSGPLAGAERTPVLLVHGTGSNPQESWRSGYLYALPRAGHPTCAVELPDRAMGDAQVSAEYVVYAIRRMAEESGRAISVVGHSQGGLHPVWALRFWTSLRGSVEDVVGLAAPYQGTRGANLSCSLGECAPAVWQQRQGSRFLEALNRELPPGPSYTSIASEFDQVVYPQPEASRLAGARNILLQQVCPGRTVDHLNILFDNLTYRLVLDALGHAGPADPARVPATVCQTTAMPVNPATFAADAATAAANFATTIATAERVSEEPPLFCYADPSSPRGVGTTCPTGTQSGERLRLRVTPSVVSAGRRVRLRFTATAGGERVAGARIRVGGRSARTNRRGRAALRVRFRRPGVRRARATHPDLRAGSARIRVVRAGGGAPRFTG